LAQSATRSPLLPTACSTSTSASAAEGRQLAQREAQFQLPLLVRLGDGIPLLGSDREPAGGQDDPPHVAPMRHAS
jgi:hypothetical protein